MDFRALGLSPHLCETIDSLGYQRPTPIQQQAIPCILKGQDILASAQTGTGKTASFLLPLIHLLTMSRGRARLSRAIVIEPTRELALQVMQSFTSFAKDLPIKAALLVGGESMTEQQKVLTRGVDVLIATPGRLLDFIERGQLMLLGIQYVIIDEADRMLDMGFMPDVNRLMAALPANKQTLLFSATFPEEIKKLADAYLKLPQEVHVAPQTRTAITIDQYQIPTENLKKRQTVRYLLDQFGQDTPTIIFCNRKREIGALISSLKRHGYQAAALHGDLAQSERNETLKHFKENEVKVLVASDVAARGLDVEKLGLVINFDVPHNPEDYVHRIGRTGRAGQEGRAFSLVNKLDQKAWGAVENFIQKKIDVFKVPTFETPKKAVATSPKKARTPLSSHKPSHKKSFEEGASLAYPVVGFGEFTPAFMLRPINFDSLDNLSGWHAEEVG